MRVRLRLFTVLFVAAALVSVVGCADSARGPVAPASAGLPLWDGPSQELFGDNIDPAAVGLSMEGPSPRADPYLRARAQTADVVARVRVNTVTADAVGDDVTYHLGIQVGVPTLTKAKVDDRSFELSIRKTGRAFPIAKAFDSRLRGLTFIGFLRRFAGPDGEPVLHWHLAPDTADVAAAIKEAMALQELSGS
jgi:hypothetical protein